MNNNVYLGNPNLKKANTAINFTQDQILEFVRCKEDPVYFARKYIKIVSLDEGLVPFNLYDFQEKLIRNFHEIVGKGVRPLFIRLRPNRRVQKQKLVMKSH